MLANRISTVGIKTASFFPMSKAANVCVVALEDTSRLGRRIANFDGAFRNPCLDLGKEICCTGWILDIERAFEVLWLLGQFL